MYLASSLVKSLKENKALTVFNLDMVACPVQSCVNKPEECSKGQRESCEKRVEILYEHEGQKKLVNLIFRYQLKGRGREGFIRSKDLALNMLLKRGILDRDTLTTA